MSKNEYWYLENEPKPNLYSWIFRNMALGAAYAGLVLVIIMFFLLALRAISFILPEDPFAALDAGTRALGAFA